MSAKITFDINDKSYEELLKLIGASGLCEYDYCAILFEGAIGKETNIIPTPTRTVECTCGYIATFRGEFTCPDCGKKMI